VEQLRHGLRRVIENLERLGGVINAPAAGPDGRRTA